MVRCLLNLISIFSMLSPQSVIAFDDMRKSCLINIASIQKKCLVKNPNDKRKFKEITLSNKLRVLLISDPNLNKSAAAMAVGVGGLSDPLDHQGISHFLEHMLFMGTKKYPNVDEYSEFVKKHQGATNAFTGQEETNYFFEVNNDAFEGSLERFSRFFYEPTLDESFVEKELNAVNSEHQKNILHDDWRESQVFRSLHKEGHPLTKFSTGDKNTLKNTTREDLLKHFKKHYSANNMTLSLLSSKPLLEMEEIAHKAFSPILLNRNFKKTNIDSELFDKNTLPRIVKIKPIKERKSIDFFFEIPSQVKNWKNKSSKILAHLIGHEGEGSLLTNLKKEGLALNLSAGQYGYSFADCFYVSIQLTPKGIANWVQVTEAFFSYVKILKKTDLDGFVFDEIKMMSELDYYYKSHQEGGDLASYYASNMQFYPGEEIDQRLELYHEFNKDNYKSLLSKISVDNLNVILVDKNNKTDKVEKFYKAEYSVDKLGKALQERLKNPGVKEGLKLPEKNHFIPDSIEVLSSDKITKAFKLIDHDFGSFWFQKDDRFHLPKTAFRIDLVSKKVNNSPANFAKSILYIKSIRESLNELIYLAKLAGVSVSLSRNNRGVSIEIHGYSDKIPDLLLEIVKHLKSISIDEQTFGAIKEKFTKELENKSLSDSYQQSLYELSVFGDGNVFHHKEIYDKKNKIDLISKVTLQEVEDYAQYIYSEIGVEGAAYGSVSKDKLKESLEEVLGHLKAKVLPRDEWPKESALISLEESKNFYLIRKNKTNNNSYVQQVVFGKTTPQLVAVLKILEAKLASDFFSELRSKQQLGYIVGAGAVFSKDFLGVKFVVQSSEYSPIEIAKRVNGWRNNFIESINSISDKDLNEIKDAVINDLSLADNTYYEKFKSLYKKGVVFEGDFEFKNNLIKAVKNLDKRTYLEYLNQIFGKKMRSMAVFMFGEKTLFEKPDAGTYVEDVKSFKLLSNSTRQRFHRQLDSIDL